MSSAIKKLFGGFHISWPQVIVFAVVAGAYTGIANQLPMLANTSFSDLAVTYECWVLFAVIVAVNCEKPLEAALKTFAFFAISQPVVFLVELPTLGASLALSYLKAWLIPIALTFPGGVLAYYMKSGGWLGTLITAVADAFLGIFVAYYEPEMATSFPRHLLTLIICLVQMAIYLVLFAEKPAMKVVVGFAGAVGIAMTLFFSQASTAECSTVLPDGNWTAELASTEGNAEVEVGDGTLTYRSQAAVANTITLTNDEGEVIVFEVVVDNGYITLLQQE